MDLRYVIHLSGKPNWVIAATDTYVGAPVVLRNKDNVDQSLYVWTFQSEDNSIALASTSNNVVLDGQSLTDNTNIVLAAYNGSGSATATQQWKFDAPYLRNVTNASYVIDNYGGYLTDGNNIIVFQFNGRASSQQWELSPYDSFK
ncbi:RICIN domain-containing protein [Burkholderia ubonensis]|uniref:RICIN domain-containing protein n=1 Tax=Burkholderia ubonensis TaxID=101571 RepID=UPI000A905735|nr:RICIN domain-containing protein [Burkholderia ubonensis]